MKIDDLKNMKISNKCFYCGGKGIITDKGPHVMGTILCSKCNGTGEVGVQERWILTEYQFKNLCSGCKKEKACKIGSICDAVIDDIDLGLIK